MTIIIISNIHFIQKLRHTPSPYPDKQNLEFLRRPFPLYICSLKGVAGTVADEAGNPIPDETDQQEIEVAPGETPGAAKKKKS